MSVGREQSRSAVLYHLRMRPTQLFPVLSVLSLVCAACQPATVEVDCDAPSSTVEAGAISGTWCGDVTATGDLQVPAGDRLVVQAGTTLTMPADAGLTIDGELVVEGTADAPVLFTSEGTWGGIALTGDLVADYLTVRGDRAALMMSAGSLEMRDSTWDLELPGGGNVDCTSFNGGDVLLEHVAFHSCHCPIHINSLDSFTATDSVFDDAVIPVMIARVEGAEFHGNVFSGSSSLVLDIGGSISADMSGNYWDGGVDISTTDPSQFTGSTDALDAPPADAGPRY